MNFINSLFAILFLYFMMSIMKYFFFLFLWACTCIYGTMVCRYMGELDISSTQGTQIKICYDFRNYLEIKLMFFLIIINVDLQLFTNAHKFYRKWTENFKKKKNYFYRFIFVAVVVVYIAVEIFMSTYWFSKYAQFIRYCKRNYLQWKSEREKETGKKKFVENFKNGEI